MKLSEETTATIAAAILAEASAKYIQKYIRRKDTKELEEFFTSTWANALCLGNGKLVWDRVQKTAREERERFDRIGGGARYFKVRHGF